VGANIKGPYGLTESANVSNTITQTKTTGNALLVQRDLAAASTSAAVVKILQDNATDDQNALLVQQDGASTGLKISQNGNGEAGLKIEGTGVPTVAMLYSYATAAAANAIYAQADGADASALRVVSDTGNNPSTNGLINVDKLATGAGNVLDIGNAGTGASIKITTADGKGPDISITGRTTANIPDAAEGSLAYDTTLHKLKVRGAAGWETVTSA